MAHSVLGLFAKPANKGVGCGGFVLWTPGLRPTKIIAHKPPKCHRVVLVPRSRSVWTSLKPSRLEGTPYTSNPLSPAYLANCQLTVSFCQQKTLLQ